MNKLRTAGEARRAQFNLKLAVAKNVKAAIAKQ